MNLLIKVTQQELEILGHAIDLWESEPTSTGIQSAMLSAMIGRGDTSEEGFKAKLAQTMDKASAASRQRKLQATRLRLKILEANSNPAEFQAPE